MRMADDCKTVIQPLGTNAEKEVETQGMMRAVLDFEGQMGLDASVMENSEHLFGIWGDGASHATIQHIKKTCQLIHHTTTPSGINSPCLRLGTLVPQV